MESRAVEPPLPFARPSIGEREIAEVLACLKSGWLATGPRVERFERELQTYLGGPPVLALASATAGLHLALLGLDLRPGDEVITTPLTFAATVNTIVQAGATPRFVDVEPETRNLAVEQVASALTPRTRAIVPVHFAGLPVALGSLYELAQRNGLRVIEDAAHAVGAEYDGRRIGSFGDTQVFSFHPNKNMTTGEGGALVTADSRLAERVRALRFHGIGPAASGPAPYDVFVPGFKYNMMDLQAAIGLHQLPRLEEFIARRSALAHGYRERLCDEAAWTLPTVPLRAQRHAWHLFTICLRPDRARISRAQFVREMKELGIGIGVHYAPVHLFRYYRERFGFKEGDFPVAESVGATIVSLPLFPDMDDRDLDRVERALRKVLL